MAPLRHRYRPGARSGGPQGYTYEEAKRFLWNPSTYEILGMKPQRLAKLILYYVVFYGCLIIFFSICMAFNLYVVVDANYPIRDGNSSLLKGRPGLSVRPMPDLQTSLIRFIQGQPASYKFYTDHLQAYLDQYDNDMQVGENFIDCSKGKTSAQQDKVCRFNLDDLGAHCTWQQDYGYDEGTPCILLKFNKVYGWTPENYPSRPALLGSDYIYNRNYMSVTCEGETPVDKENMGTVEFYPSHGFPFFFFPYLNQEGFRTPIVMARFMNATNGIIINIWCKAWAYNVKHHRDDMMGSVHFELLMD